MATIHKLDKQTINSIAAGEVVERPASVAKELIDNSLDAGASIIRVALEAGGIKRLLVEDDGCGMSQEDVKLSLESHATSKLTSVDDLLRIKTMGFRGEALASIAAVSRLELRSRLIGDESGSSVKAEGGKIIATENIGMKEGTVIIVRDLFFNTPARFKFLKSDRAETAALVDMVGRLALSRPDVSFRVERLEDRKDLLHTPGNNDLLSAIYAVFGRELAESMVTVKHSESPISVEGYMTLPEHARHNRSRQLFIVNERVIESPTLRAAVDEASKTWFMKGRFPALVLKLDIPAELVDVNVHPQKSEIRVWDEKILFRSVYHAIQNSLNDQDGISKANDSFLKHDINNAEKSPLSNSVVYKEQFYPTVKESSQIHFADSPNLRPRAKNENVMSKKELVETQEKVEQAEPIQEAEKKLEQVHDNEIIGASALNKARYIGSVLATYLLFEAENSLFIIDQHAAHERILYERLLNVHESSEHNTVLSQTLLLPVKVNLSAGEMSFFLDYKEEFQKLGFDCDPFGDNSIVIRAVPSSGSNRAELEPVAAFRAILERATSNCEPDLVFNDTEVFHDIACKAAVKANDSLSQPEAEALLESLLQMENPYHCPHGRPIILRLTSTQLEKLFGRIV